MFLSFVEDKNIYPLPHGSDVVGRRPGTVLKPMFMRSKLLNAMTEKVRSEIFFQTTARERGHIPAKSRCDLADFRLRNLGCCHDLILNLFVRHLITSGSYFFIRPNKIMSETYCAICSAGRSSFNFTIRFGLIMLIISVSNNFGSPSLNFPSF